MSYSSLEEFIITLENNNELVRVKEYVNPHLEITEVVDRISKTSQQNKAILFENTKTNFPILINSLGSYNRMCLAFKVKDLDQIAVEIQQLFLQIQGPKKTILDKLKLIPTFKKLSDYAPKKIKGKGACQKNMMPEPDLSKLPILKCWPKDGGCFITLPIIHTISIENQSRNVGMYRMQVFDNKTTGMHWHKHKVSAKHYHEYKKRNLKMPVAVALGGDPVYTYASTAPLPENVDEYLLAGFIRKKGVELVQCLTQPDIWVPSDSDIIIEGYVDPQEDLLLEGPFGDHTGFYSLEDFYPAFHVTAITYKDGAVYPTTIVGIPPQEDAWIGKATERIFLAPIKMTLCPEMIDMDMPLEGVFHNLVIAKIQKDFVGQAAKIMNAMWGAGQMMFNKILIITDQHQSIQDYDKLSREGLFNFNPFTDVYKSKGPMDVLDHSCSKFAYGGKLCLDLTKKIEEEIDDNFLNEAPLNYHHLNILTMDESLVSLNSDLWYKYKIPVLIVGIKKTKKEHIKNLHSKIMKKGFAKGMKIIIYLDEQVDTSDVSTCLWLLANNIDPNRDVYVETIYVDNNKYFSCMGVDGTIKTKELDGFDRPWPNIIVSDDETIASVDKKWNKLGLGKTIISPSLKYKKLLLGREAKI